MPGWLTAFRGPQVQQCLLGCFAAVHAGGPEEHDRVLDVFSLESSGRLEILGQDANRTGVGGVEEVGILVSERLLVRHAEKTVSFSHDGRGRPTKGYE